jgi:diadenylate cyclase
METENKLILDFLKKVSPGTPLRIVIDDLLRSNMGALIVFNSPELGPIMDGGFKVNCAFSAQRLFELCKMDGAVIISPELDKIIYANVLLTPDPTISTTETGTRHIAGERTAKQANTPVIAVSERRRKTTLFFPKSKQYLRGLDEILREVTSSLQILDEQRELLDEAVSKLTILEMSGLVSVSDVCKVIQRAEIMLRISDSIKKYFTELGTQGSILNLRYKELLRGIERLRDFVIRDYSTMPLQKTNTLISNITFDGLLDLDAIALLLLEKKPEENVMPKGFRFFSYLSIDEKEVSQLVDAFISLNKIFSASAEDLDKILAGKGEKLKQDIDNLREQILSGKVIF